MATVLGTVISVSLETEVKKQGGGSYKGWELVYRSDNNEVRTIAKPVQGLRFNAALKNSLSSLNAGDQFTLTQEKNAQGFNDVKSITKGWDAAAGDPVATQAPPTVAAAQKQAAPSNTYTQRDYETKEEREKKQKFIIRQSSISNAIELLSVGAKAAPKKEEVLELAQEFVNFVYEGTPQEVALQAVADIEDDIPY